MTVTVREKGKKLEESGGLVMTSDMWLAPKSAGYNEIADFYKRMGKKLDWAPGGARVLLYLMPVGMPPSTTST
jgi:hypothetical protein